jgi:hypothetical protein
MAGLSAARVVFLLALAAGALSESRNEMRPAARAGKDSGRPRVGPLLVPQATAWPGAPARDRRPTVERVHPDLGRRRADGTAEQWPEWWHYRMAPGATRPALTDSGNARRMARPAPGAGWDWAVGHDVQPRRRLRGTRAG